MSVYRFIVSSRPFRLVLMCLILFSTALSQAAAQQQKPNIIFILTDDMGYTDLSCYGNPYNQTPHIDELAAQGMRFSQAYVASPICSPSRAAIMTGKHPARLHLTNFLVGNRTDSDSPLLPAEWATEGLSGSEVTLAELLKKEGYTNGMVGKWHLGSKKDQSPTSQGFDYDRVIAKNGLDYYNYSITGNNETVFEDDGTEYLTDKLTDYAIDFIQENKDQPFFLYLAYSAPHVFIVPRGDKLRKYMLKYNQAEEKYNPDYIAALEGRTGIAPMKEYKALFNPYYAALLESLDDGVGKITRLLKALDLDQNTLIVFTSDNGGVGLPELGPIPTNSAPLRKWKGFMYEGGSRVPLIVKWPGKIEEEVVNEHYITGTDYLPTLMEILGVKELPAEVDGKSFLPTLYRPAEKFDRGPIYWHYPHFSNQGSRPAGAVRNGDYKLVENFETGQLELYNIKEDIGENVDLSNAQPQKTTELAKLLKEWRENIGANMPVPNPDYKK